MNTKVIRFIELCLIPKQYDLITISEHTERLILANELVGDNILLKIDNNTYRFIDESIKKYFKD